MPSLTWDLIVRQRGGGLDDMADDMDGLGDHAKGAGKAIAAGLGAAGAAGAALLAKGWADNVQLEVGNDKLAGQMGLTAVEAEKAGKTAATVYGDNWGESMDDVNEAIRSVGQNIGDLSTMSQADISDITEKALALSSTMGTDLPLTTEAAGAMMKNGLAANATEAFDIITAGMQNGVNKADDLLETFQEYSPQFKKLGIGGKDALNLLSAGLKAGARDTDVVADAFKELSIRAIDGSDSTIEGYKLIGLNAKTTAADMAAGGDRARKATDKILQGLVNINDPKKRNDAGTDLFGTQWEDTLRDILPAMLNTDGAIKNIDGSTQKMADTVGDNAQGRIDTLKRGFEQWTQSMASSDGALGTVVTGVATFGGGAMQAASQVGIMAVALKGSTVATWAGTAATTASTTALGAMKFAWIAATGPIGLITIGVLAAAAGLIYAYKHSEKFRNICNTVFKAVATAVLTFADRYLQAMQIVFNVMGKVPGKVGAPFRAAASEVGKMRSKVQGLRADINRVQSKKVTITVHTSFYQTGKAPGTQGNGLGVWAPGRAAGGPVKAYTPYIVGESGMETFVPTQDGVVIPNNRTGIGGGGYYSGGNPKNHISPRSVTVVVKAGAVLGSARELRSAVVDAFNAAPAGAAKLPRGSVAN